MSKKIFLFLFALLYIPNISVAEIKTYTHTVKQRFGGSQSADDARVAAIARAKREVLERAGTYLESLTIIKNHLVDKDEVQILAAGVLKTEVVSEKRYASEDAYGIIVTVKVDINTKVLENRISKLLQDRELLEKYRAVKQREKKLLTRIEKLEEQNQKLDSLPPQRRQQKKEELEAQFNETAASLKAIEWVARGIAKWGGEDSKIWHHGYGGGLWMSPFSLAVLSATYEWSKDESAGLFAFRFRFLF